MAATTRFLGCVLNPKTLLPCPVYKEKTRTIEVYDPLLEDKEGTGYYDDGDHGPKYSASEATGYPRVHTPSGVKTRAAGYGTVLYTGLCLGAKLINEGILDLDVSLNADGAGISSNENRSHAADAWWSAAKDTFDLAYSEQVSSETTEDFDESYTRTSGSVFVAHGRDLSIKVIAAVSEILADYGEHVDITKVRVEGERKTEEGSTADVYPYDRNPHGATRGLLAPGMHCVGAATMVPFWFVSDAYDGSDHLWEWSDAPDAAHIQVFDDVFGCMLLTGDVDSELVRFIQKVAIADGKKKLFDEVLLVSLLGKKIEEAGETAWGSDTLYEGLRPFRLNPEDPAVQAAAASMTKNERVAIERRAERIRALGLDKLSDFDL